MTLHTRPRRARPPGLGALTVTLLVAPLTVLLAALLLTVMSVLPIFSVAHLPANDYPFHLARIAILSMGESSGLLGSHYRFGSWLLPNMALDAFALPLTVWLSPEAAVRLFLVVMQVAFLAGCVALHRAAFGRYSAWPLLGGLLLYNGIFLFGFFNYLFTAAFALLGAALWLRMQPGWVRRGVTFCLALALMWGHMGGFAVYAILISAFQLQARLAPAARRNGPGAVGALVLDFLPFVAALALFVALSPGRERAAEGLVYDAWWAAKPLSALFALQSGVLWADMLVLLTLAGLVLALLVRRQLTVSGALLAAAGSLWLAFVVLPPEMLGSSFADVRLVPVAALVSLLALAPRPSHRLTEAVVLTVALGLGGVKTAALINDWRRHEPQIDNVVQALKQIPAGSTLFAATAEPYTSMWLGAPGAREGWHPPLKHVASYASVVGSVFVPMTFADPHKQPMVMAPAYLAVKNLQGDNPFKVPQPADLQALARRLTAETHVPGRPDLGRVFLLVVGTDRYPTTPATTPATPPATPPQLAEFTPFVAAEKFVIYRATERDGR